MESPDSQTTVEAVELDQRKSDKLTVTLWWLRGTIDTYVTVTSDVRADNQFIPVPEGVPPHEVYYHPFAFVDQVES